MKRSTWITYFLFFLVVFLFVGCATIIHGTHQNITVNSSPSGAKVIVQGIEKGKTPTVINLPRGESGNLILHFEKEGYEPVDIMLKKEVDWLLVGGGNCLLFGGILGFAVDFVTGAAYTLTPSEVNTVLQKMGEQGMNLKNMQKNGDIAIVVDLAAMRK